MHERRLLLTEHAITTLARHGTWQGRTPLPGPYRMVAPARMQDLCLTVLPPHASLTDLPDCWGVVVAPGQPAGKDFARLSILRCDLPPQALFAAVMPDSLLSLTPQLAAWAGGSG